VSKNIKVSDTDKNQHLSQSLAGIQDYGPAGAVEDLDDYKDDDYKDDGYEDASYGDDRYGGDSDEDDDFEDASYGDDRYVNQSSEDPDQALADAEDDEPGYGTQTAPAPVQSRRSNRAIPGLALLLLMVVTAAGYYFYSRLDQIESNQIELAQIQQQATALRMEPPPRVPEIEAHSHPENASLALLEQRIVSLESQLAELRNAPLFNSNTDTETDTGEKGGSNSIAPGVSESPAPGPSGITAPAPPAGAEDTVAESEEVAANTAAPWFVNLGSFKLETVARGWAGNLENPPRPIQVIPVNSAGRTFYRVRISGFTSRAEAQATALKLKDQWQLDATWVGDE
jgi:cell division septation protein DedD